MTKYDFYSDKFIQEGWICPRCGRVNAPWLPNCSCGSNETIVTTDRTAGPHPSLKVTWTNEDALSLYGTPIKDIDWSTTFGRAEDYESYLMELHNNLFKKDRNEDSDETDL